MKGEAPPSGGEGACSGSYAHYGHPPPPAPAPNTRRRSGSEDSSRNFDGSGAHGPPSYISYQPISGDDGKDRIDSNALPRHQRVSSWSAVPPSYHAVVPGGYASSPSAGQPPFLSGAPVPFAFHPTEYTGSRHSRRSADGHRRVHSFSGASYGAAGGGSPVPSASMRNQAGKAGFSPKAEFMKLTESLRSRANSPVPPPSPGLVGMYMPPTGMQDPNAPRIFGMNGETVSSTHNYLSAGNRSLNGAGGSGDESGGEAVFSANRKKNGKHKRSQSKRMHMRQKSAQLFMQDVKGAAQTPSCRDIIFLILFVFHLLGIVYLGKTYGNEAVRYHDEDDGENDSSITIVYQNLIYLCTLSGLFAIVMSACMFLVMMAIAKKLVQIALVVTIALSFVCGTMGIGLSPTILVPATGIIALALSVVYAIVVWDRCKFHGANLYTSLTGIRANPGAVILGFFFQFLAIAWSIYYTYVAVGVYDAVQIGLIELPTTSSKVLLYLSLAVSYYWTLQVFLNIVQVTVASVIGSWWFIPDGDTRTRGRDLQHAFFSAIFYSIGSICYGSLLIGPVRFLRQMSALFQPNEKNHSLLCFHECIYCIQSCLASFVDILANRYNPWAFTYVGLYGYDLTGAGLHSTELFEKRGWTTIVSDDLVPNVLLITTLAIGGVTGCFAYMLNNAQALTLTSLNAPEFTAFLVGALVGFVASSVLFGIVSSSVNAVIVCFASTPLDFHTNHPALSAEMRQAWREVWPGCMDVVDIRMAVATYMDPASNPAVSEHQPLLGL